LDIDFAAGLCLLLAQFDSQQVERRLVGGCGDNVEFGQRWRDLEGLPDFFANDRCLELGAAGDQLALDADRIPGIAVAPADQV
jgi:hypothetical protein